MLETVSPPLVLVFSTAYLPYQGGAELAVYHIATRLPEYEFAILTSRFSRALPKEERRGNIRVIRIGFGFSFDKWLLPVLASMYVFRNFRAERSRLMLWGVMISYGTVGAYIIKRFWNSVPFLVSLQEGDSEQHLAKGKFGIIHMTWRIVLRRADHIHAISNFLRDRAQRFHPRGAISVIPNGVDVQRFACPNKGRVEELRRAYALSDSPHVIMTVSRLVEKNGIPELTDAVALLPEFTLVLIGEGPLRHNLEERIRSLGVEKRVRMVGDVPHDALPEHLALGDIFVRASRSEGLGNAFLEAMASSRAVIGTRTGGIVDFLVDGENGIFVPIQNPQAIRDAVHALSTDVPRMRRIQKAGYETVRARYDWALLAQDMAGVFRAFSSHGS